MEQTPIITPIHKKFLELVVKEPYLLKKYYWTGGTVLSGFYLYHRESYDIDLFSEEEVNIDRIKHFVGIVGKLLKTKKISYSRFLGLHTFVYSFANGSQLKVDFNYYPFPRIERGGKYQGLSLDSLLDIAVNKIHTISINPRGRDYVDVYFILKNEQFSLEKLIDYAKAKFDWHIEPMQLGENFAKVSTFSDFPKMLVRFEPKEMEDFFLKLAKDLKKDIFY